MNQKFKFQFQYGAIKSCVILSDGFGITKFQFQYGAIKSAFDLPEHPEKHKFQFQYGAIKSYQSQKTTHLAHQVSIPIWCN